ncbi:hypothetical protein F5Y09DRAFT_357493 [Xylaria sp. FL1042]|nr:hypothetical protein F5Y09DRAFT_357493 [Xylaria sp. FL1042]
MLLRSNRVIGPPAEILVETNNFHQVLQHFNESCEIANIKTRFTIECQICKCKNLALTNPEFDMLAEDTHENYIVLPYCGHAFGSSCLQQWIQYQKAHTRVVATCPSCRSQIHCKNKHQLKTPIFGPKADKAPNTSEDVAKIRATLGSCTQCLDQERSQAENEEANRLNRIRALSSRAFWPSAELSKPELKSRTMAGGPTQKAGNKSAVSIRMHELGLRRV